MAGLDIADLCEPAREVGGDYYDFFELGPRQLGVLIADVSGKGTSAALYMAELKGLMLALSHTERSPRRLLIDVNRLLAEHLDNRSFITMTYAVIDLERADADVRARRAHAAHRASRGGRSEVVTPDGMVLGLRLPGAASDSSSCSKKHTQPLVAGRRRSCSTPTASPRRWTRTGELFGDAALARVVAASTRSRRRRHPRARAARRQGVRRRRRAARRHDDGRDQGATRRRPEHDGTPADRPIRTPVEIFRSHSSIEAEVVRGLLDAHGIDSVVPSALSPSVFPDAVRARRVPRQRRRPRGAARARELIAGHLDEAAAAEVRRLSETLGSARRRASATSSATSACSSTR